MKKKNYLMPVITHYKFNCNKGFALSGLDVDVKNPFDNGITDEDFD